MTIGASSGVVCKVDAQDLAQAKNEPKTGGLCLCGSMAESLSHALGSVA